MNQSAALTRAFPGLFIQTTLLTRIAASSRSGVDASKFLQETSPWQTTVLLPLQSTSFFYYLIFITLHYRIASAPDTLLYVMPFPSVSERRHICVVCSTPYQLTVVFSITKSTSFTPATRPSGGSHVEFSAQVKERVLCRCSSSQGDNTQRARAPK